MRMAQTRVFMNGTSQAVCIPQAFRLPGSRLQISRNADSDLVIRELPLDRGTALLQAFDTLSDEARAGFVAILEENRLIKGLKLESWT